MDREQEPPEILTENWKPTLCVRRCMDTDDFIKIAPGGFEMIQAAVALSIEVLQQLLELLNFSKLFVNFMHKK